ncbi:MAG: IS1 family transposase [Actinobacteria bacterium]|nr:IS1 family transposase [Actinomycetota bacterium]
MDPRIQFCHNAVCPARGQAGRGNIRVHSRKERRYQCRTCQATFAETTGTPYYRLHQAAEVMTTVLTLLCHGCPLQAIVAAFELDERTVAAWQAKAGEHCRAVHGHLVLAGRVDAQHVQADELWAKRVGGRLWQAMALAVPSRLWLGGVLSPRRDRALITDLVRQVRAAASSPAILVCVDGLSSYVTAFQRVFRRPVRTGRVGRPRLVAEGGLLLGQVVKRYVKRHVVDVEQRAVLGTVAAIAAVLAATGTGTMIHTAYIERLNATFRACLAPLVRRGRALARTEAALTAGMYLVGCAYNFCWEHASLRLAAPPGSPLQWRERTPAIAAGLTGHRWTMDELLHYQVPLPAWVPPKRRGRPPKQPQPTALAAAA